MITVKGKFNEAIIYTDNCEENAIAQVKALCDLEVYEGCRIRIMPDVHVGKYCPIGTTIALKDKVIPYTVGIDIGCGITCFRFKTKKLELNKLDRVIRENIPHGMSRHDKPIVDLKDPVIKNLYKLKCFDSISMDKALRCIGTLGGGNHFIEVADKDEEGYYYIYIHSGSRYLGVQVAEYYQKKAYDKIKEFHPDVPFEFAWLEGQDFEDYIHDMDIVLLYAYLNRKCIFDIISNKMKFKDISCIIDSPHNYIGDYKDSYILRKGAASTSARPYVIIPINMKEGAMLCLVKESTEKWNYSAPHGSGRKMAKSEVANNYTVNSYKKDMEGIYCSVIGKNTLEESPYAYKSKDDIIGNLTNLHVSEILKPIYNFKSDKKGG